MKNISIFKNLKNPTVIVYISLIIGGAVTNFDAMDNERLKLITIVLSNIAAILGVLDNPNTSKFLDN